MMWNIHNKPTYASINISASGNTTLVPAVAGSTPFVMAMAITVSADTNITLSFTSVALGTDQVAFFKLKANQTMALSALDYTSGEPYYEGRPGQSFVINSSATADVTGTITYAYNE